MGKSKMTLYSKITLVSGAVLVLLAMILYFMIQNNLYLYVFGISSSEIITVILLLAPLFIISGGTVWLRRVTKHKKLVMVCAVILLFIALCIFLTALFFSCDARYFDFYSDDGNHHIVVREESFLLAGYGQIYEVTSPGVMTYIYTYLSDDGYRPFSNGEYKFEWLNQGFVLSYYFGAGHIESDDGWRIQKLSYIEQKSKD